MHANATTQGPSMGPSSKALIVLSEKLASWSDRRFAGSVELPLPASSALTRQRLSWTHIMQSTTAHAVPLDRMGMRSPSARQRL